MSFLSEFKLSALLDDQDFYLKVEDISAYPIDGKTAVQTARVLFWSKDGFSTVDGADLNNGSDNGIAKWNVSILNQETYNVVAAIVSIWDVVAHTEYLINSITYYNGDFYRIKVASIYSDGGSIPNVNDTTNFEFLSLSTHTATQLYAHFDTAVITGNIEPGIGYTTVYQKIDCVAFTLQKTGCHAWLLTDTANVGDSITSITRNDIGNTILETLWSGGALPDGELAISNSEDLVNMIVVNYDRKIVMLPMYDLCDAETCYGNLFRELYCGDDDPCAETNGDCFGEENAQKYDDLFQLHALIVSIREKIFEERSKFYYVLGRDEAMEDFVFDINLMVEKLKIVTERCGECNG